MPGCGTTCSSQHRMPPVEVVKKAELYFRSLGFPALMPHFWERSIFSRPFNRTNLDCHASAYDFGNGRDYRIKVCLDGSPTDFETVLHELGHVHYFMEYRHRPSLLRTAPLGAIHEAIGDAFSHGKSCEGPSKSEDAIATPVHNLLREALLKIVSLPWILALETWRYRVLRGRISVQDLASSLWELRRKFQGIAPPNSEARGYFDIGGKYHVANFMPYMRYFFARLLEYQFLQSMCTMGDPEASLHNCCFLEKEASGRSIRHMMSYGAAIPWRTALLIATGSETIDVEPLLEYYQPLHVWLKAQNERLKNPVGW
ncbi:angiotensin-converting enzyme-related protein-like [Ornithodoros turicata]|uniref:angiotensin-converting enzyme-related protein-like n=1 Tax=Ornithodoros turicata TaxID=34597 RepID=UPI0031393F01